MKDYRYNDFKDDYSVEEDYFGREDELSFSYTLSQAFRGDTEAQGVLGYIYSTNGHGVKTDYEKAVFWYYKSAQNGNINDTKNLADLYFGYEKKGFANDYSLALKYYKLAASGGNVRAAVRLGIMYFYGLGTPCNKLAAEKLFAPAAENGDAEACYYYYLILSERGGDKAQAFLEKAAEGGFGRACGEVVKKRKGLLLDKKFLFYLTCAANDYSKFASPAGAQLALAHCFLNGLRVKKDLDAAKSYYMMAAEAGSGYAMRALKRHFGVQFGN